MKNITLAAAAFGAVIAGASAQPAAAYPIDCAILLCLAGGFPASVECTAAKAEMIRRITPWPIEPPLQLWNCPLSIPSDLAAQIGMSNANLGADGLTPDVRKYRDAVEIYHIERYAIIHQHDEPDRTIDQTKRGVYDANGDFHWVRSSYESGPAWLAKAVGGRRITVRTCKAWTNDHSTCRQYSSYQTNRAGGWGRLRGVAIRTQDWEGNYQTEWVPY